MYAWYVSAMISCKLKWPRTLSKLAHDSSYGIRNDAYLGFTCWYGVFFLPKTQSIWFGHYKTLGLET